MSTEVETTEGKRARFHRGQVMSILAELVEAMEVARSEGFLVQFAIPQTPDGINTIGAENLTIIKKW